jgi:hypothetical protein
MTPSNRDWPEDFEINNGNYFCQCCLCNEQFTGHKRRVICKRCALAQGIAQPAPAEVAQGEVVEVVGWADESIAAFITHDCKQYGESMGGAAGSAVTSHKTALMTVAQHTRIVADMATQPDAELVALMVDVLDRLRKAQIFDLSTRVAAKLASIRN